eukprot:UN08013
MLHFRIITTFGDLLQGHRVFRTILFQLSVRICPRICKSSLSFLDIQNRSKSAKNLTQHYDFYIKNSKNARSRAIHLKNAFLYEIVMKCLQTSFQRKEHYFYD